MRHHTGLSGQPSATPGSAPSEATRHAPPPSGEGGGSPGKAAPAPQTICARCGKPVPAGENYCSCGEPCPRDHPPERRTVLLSWIVTVGGMAGLLWLAANYAH